MLCRVMPILRLHFCSTSLHKHEKCESWGVSYLLVITKWVRTKLNFQRNGSGESFSNELLQARKFDAR